MQVNLSIIIPLFNSKDDLDVTLRSIEKYCSGSFEVIVVDALSTDGWLSIINCFQNSFLLRTFSEPDSGEYDAMNKGIQLSSGEFCIFMMAGDSFIKPFNVNNVKEPVMFPVIRGNDGKEIKLKSRFFGLPNCHQGIIFEVKKNIRYDLTYRIASDFDFYLRHFVESDPKFDAELTKVCYDEGHSGSNFLVRDFEILAIIKNYFPRAIFYFVFIWMKIKHAAK